MTSQPGPPLPSIDTVSKRWWDARAERTFLLQWCLACRQAQHYPRALCTACGGTELRYGPSSGRGRLHSFTVVHRSPNEWLEAPYVVALVVLEEGPTVLSHLVEYADGDLTCDRAVELTWVMIAGLGPMPAFRPSQADRRRRLADQ